MLQSDLNEVLEPLNLDDADCGRELVHAAIQPLNAVAGLAVVTECARVLDDVGVPRDHGTTLAGRDRLGRCERPDACVARCPRTAAMPARSVCVSAVLDQENPLGSAELGDLLDVECDVSADVDEDRSARLVRSGLLLEVFERHAQIGSVAVHELDAAPCAERG